MLQTDVLAAFDYVDYRILRQALIKGNIPHTTVDALLRELTVLDVEGELMGTRCEFRIQRGIPQGSPASMLIWQYVTRWVVDPLKKTWDADGWGIAFPSCYFNCLLYADNVWLVATSTDQAMLMASSLADHLHRCGLFIKKSSLQTMSSDVCDHEHYISIPQPDGNVFANIEKVTPMDILGIRVDSKANFNATLEAGIAAAKACFWKHRGYLLARSIARPTRMK